MCLFPQCLLRILYFLWFMIERKWESLVIVKKEHRKHVENHWPRIYQQSDVSKNIAFSTRVLSNSWQPLNLGFKYNRGLRDFLQTVSAISATLLRTENAFNYMSINTSCNLWWFISFVVHINMDKQRLFHWCDILVFFVLCHWHRQWQTISENTVY